MVDTNFKDMLSEMLHLSIFEHDYNYNKQLLTLRIN